MRFLLKENKASVIAQSIGKITYEEIRHLKIWLSAMVVAQLEERSLPTPEVYGSTPVIGKLLITYILSNVLKGLK